MKKFAFTLSEVLMTLAIIGVIFAMTVSSLINSIQDQEFRASAKKAYNTLQNAITMKNALTETTPADVTNGKLLWYLRTNHYDDKGGVVNRTAQVLKNVHSSDSGGGVIAFTDGQVWGVPTTKANAKNYCTEATPCHLMVDLNGPGGPNKNAPNQGWKDVYGDKLEFGAFDNYTDKTFNKTEYDRKYRDIVYFEISGMNVRPYTKHGVTRRYFGNGK